MLDKALEWFDRISKTPLKNRIFVLMLFMVFLLVATNVTTWIHLTNKEKEANSLRIQAETDLKIQLSLNLTDNKTYPYKVLTKHPSMRMKFIEKVVDKFQVEVKESDFLDAEYDFPPSINPEKEVFNYEG